MLLRKEKRDFLNGFRPSRFSGGAKNGTRTRDPDLGKVVLYQLSYFRIIYVGNPADTIVSASLSFPSRLQVQI
jgi:hypothetical protein